jgi:hypothetical protein
MVSHTPVPPRHFVVEGRVDGWDPATRVLQIELDERRFIVSPTVTRTIPSKGMHVTGSGHVDADGQWIITDLARRY